MLALSNRQTASGCPLTLAAAVVMVTVVAPRAMLVSSLVLLRLHPVVWDSIPCDDSACKSSSAEEEEEAKR